MSRAWITAFVLPLLSFAGCSDTTHSTACAKDTDCKGNRLCVAGSCTSEDGGDSTPDGATASGGGGQSSSNGGTSSGGSRSSGGARSASDSGALGDGASAGGTRSGGDGSAVPECTQRDLSACPFSGLPACCTRAGTCGVNLLGACRATGQAPREAGTGAGGTTGGGIVSAQCMTCRASNCAPEAAACKASAKCATLSSCIDSASPFGLLGCLSNLDQPTRTTYQALSSCASTNCASCPNINL